MNDDVPPWLDRLMLVVLILTLLAMMAYTIGQTCQ